jgi:hypothetical protein
MPQGHCEYSSRYLLLTWVLTGVLTWYSEYSRRYLLLMLLMFYGTLMFALEYARAAMVATLVLSSRQRSAMFV